MGMLMLLLIPTCSMVDTESDTPDTVVWAMLVPTDTVVWDTLVPTLDTHMLPPDMPLSPPLPLFTLLASPLLPSLLSEELMPVLAVMLPTPLVPSMLPRGPLMLMLMLMLLLIPTCSMVDTEPDTPDTEVWDTPDTVVWDTPDTEVWDTPDTEVWDTPVTPDTHMPVNLFFVGN